MSKIITVLGGNGYVGKKCIETLINNNKNIKVYAVCRSGKLDDPKYKFDDRVEVIKGDSLNPSSFEDIILKSDGIIHSIGALFATTEEYHRKNKETLLKVAEIADKKNEMPRVPLLLPPT